MSTTIDQLGTLYYMGRPASLQEVYLFTSSGEFGFLTELREIDSNNIMLNELSLKSVLRDIAHVAASSGAVAATAGMGGDTIVDALFAIEASAGAMKTIDNLIDGASELGQALANLQGLSIKNGTKVIYDKVKRVVLGIIKVAGKKAQEIITKIADQIDSLLERLASTVADWISAALPDDAGLGGPIIRETLLAIVNAVAEHPYDLLGKLVNKIPVIMQPEKIKEFFTMLVDNFVKFLGEMENPKTFGKKLLKKAAAGAKMAATTMNPSLMLVAKAASKMTGKDLASIKGIKEFLDTTIRENIPVAVATFEKIMTLFFSVVAALQVVMQYDTGESKDDKDADDAEQSDATDDKTDEPAATPADDGGTQDKKSGEVLGDGHRIRPKNNLTELRKFIHYALEEA